VVDDGALAAGAVGKETFFAKAGLAGSVVEIQQPVVIQIAGGEVVGAQCQDVIEIFGLGVCSDVAHEAVGWSENPAGAAGGADADEYVVVILVGWKLQLGHVVFGRGIWQCRPTPCVRPGIASKVVVVLGDHGGLLHVDRDVDDGPLGIHLLGDFVGKIVPVIKFLRERVRIGPGFSARRRELERAEKTVAVGIVGGREAVVHVGHAEVSDFCHVRLKMINLLVGVRIEHAIAVGRRIGFLVLGVEGDAGGAELVEFVLQAGKLGLFQETRRRDNHHRREDRDDGDYGEQFDQCEAPGAKQLCHGSSPVGVSVCMIPWG
jgi:hypothetical protein